MYSRQAARVETHYDVGKWFWHARDAAFAQVTDELVQCREARKADAKDRGRLADKLAQVEKERDQLKAEVERLKHAEIE